MRTISASSVHYVTQDNSSYYSRSIPFIDYATISVITFLLLLSLLSLFSIFHLRFKSRSSIHLQSFNNLWTLRPRLLLVIFISFWALFQIPRLPFIRLPLPFSIQSHLCKLHLLLSLGFLQPAFLITLVHLINLSIKQPHPSQKWSLLFVILMTLPTLIIQIIFIFFTPLTRSSLLYVDKFGDKRMICTYPSISSIVFCLFAIVYSMGLLVACWRVGSLVINKTMRVRINMLGVVLMMGLLVQTLFLGLESLWMPEKIGVGVVSLGVFLSVVVCCVVAEIVLVINPIMEVVETGRDYLNCRVLGEIAKTPMLPNDG